MNKNSIKEEIIQLYKQLVNKYLLTNNLLNNEEELSVIISNCIDCNILTDNDYKTIKEKVLIDSLLLKKDSLFSQTKNIIKLITNQLDNYTLEYPYNENDQTIHFHLNNQQSFLINYDDIDHNWYLSLIDSITLDLIKEIYHNEYNDFIKYLEIYLKKVTE